MTKQSKIKYLISLLIFVFIAISFIFGTFFRVVTREIPGASAEGAYEVSTISELISRLNNAQDGDIIKLANDIVNGSNAFDQGFRIPANRAVTLDLNGKQLGNLGSQRWNIYSGSSLFVKNGRINHLDTSNDSNGCLILSNVTIDATLYLGVTDAYIVNNCHISTLRPEFAKVNSGTNLNPVIGKSDHTEFEYSYSNPAPAIVGAGTTWRAMGSLQECCDLIDGETYKYIILIDGNAIQEGSADIYKPGTILDLNDGVLKQDNGNLHLKNTQGKIIVRNGTITGDLDMVSAGITDTEDYVSGEIELSNLTIEGNIYNDSHPVIINSGNYRSVGQNKSTITINGGYFSGVLTEDTVTEKPYQISGGKFANKPVDSYIKSGYDIESIDETIDGIRYSYEVVKHVHGSKGWNYSAQNNKLTINCWKDDNYSKELTLNATSVNYSGDNISASLDATQAEDWTKAGFTLPTIYYEGYGNTVYGKTTTAPTNVGTYKASITIKDSEENEFTAIKEFSINKANLTKDNFSLNPTSDTYNGQDKTLNVNGPSDFTGNITLKYSSDGGNTWTEDKPKNAGTYKVKAIVSNDNGEFVLNSDFTINKADLTRNDFSLNPTSDTYNGQDKTLNVNGPSDFTGNILKISQKMQVHTKLKL